MSKRRLLDGSEVEEFEEPINIIIHTKAPAKWKFTDLETGEEYLGSGLPHPIYGEELRKRTSAGLIGSLLKTKLRIK